MARNSKSRQSKRNASDGNRSGGSRGQQPRESDSMEKLRSAAARADERLGVSAGGTIANVQRNVSAVGRGIADASGRAVGAVASNPIPAAMIGAGLAWMLVQSVNS